MKNISNMPENCIGVLFYEGSNEEYFGFLTPEASKAHEGYLDERRKDGEYIDENSPVFRSSYQVGIQKVKPMSTASAKMIALRIVKSIVRYKQGRRYSIISAHGIRNRFNTILKSADNANQALCEKLMGHRGIFHLDGSYLTPSKVQLFLEKKVSGLQEVYQVEATNSSLTGQTFSGLGIVQFFKNKIKFFDFK